MYEKYVFIYTFFEVNTLTNNIDMTSSEMGYLWATYQTQTINWCFLKYFDLTLEDEQTKSLNEQLLSSCERNLNKIKEIFEVENFPLPTAFGISDLNLKAEKLYTDPFMLYYLWFVAKGDLNYSSIALNTVARLDIVTFYSDLVTESLIMLNKSRELLLNKGLWIRSPYIPIPEEASFITRQNFLNGWFGKKRPLTGQEIAAIFYNIITNQVGHELMKSFIQVTKSDDIKVFLQRGKELAKKQVTSLSQILSENDLPIPTTWNAGVTLTKISPFTDRLMLNMIAFLNGQSISNYGMGIANSFRRDISSTFSRLAAEIAVYSEDATNLLIEKQWLECPPQARSRD